MYIYIYMSICTRVKFHKYICTYLISYSSFQFLVRLSKLARLPLQASDPVKPSVKQPQNSQKTKPELLLGLSLLSRCRTGDTGAPASFQSEILLLAWKATKGHHRTERYTKLARLMGVT